MVSIRWGIIAPGRIAHKFASDFSLIHNHSITSVASTNIERARAFADKYKLSSFYGDYREMLVKEKLDIVYIASPHSFHFEQAKMCLDLGISVLCEKPVTIHSGQLKQLLTLAAEKGLFFMEALWTVFLPTYTQIFEKINNGDIGSIIGVKADFGFHMPFDQDSRLFNPSLGGGSLLDIGIYPLLLATLCLGYPDEIKALASLTELKVDDEMIAVLKYNKRGLAQIQSTIRANTRTEAFIFGDNGSFWVTGRWIDSQKFYLLKSDGQEELIHSPWDGFGYQFQISAVEKCLAQGLLECPLVPHSLSIQLMNQMDEIRKQTGIVYPEDAFNYE
ncbi:MAG: Gfo/Idh/MocA family oxidoreductase [Haliscomenobacter sp.]|nr:Gfo/Idh/MocA family oxidoreductase [Haliscomenobacter sp.]MCF8318123.1 Gfo/Idh/MocA family oxidoreductase [Haliscomenobacter sp.]